MKAAFVALLNVTLNVSVNSMFVSPLIGILIVADVLPAEWQKCAGLSERSRYRP